MARTSTTKRPKAAAPDVSHSLRALARKLGVHASTVADAVARGQLASCVVMVDGSPRIRDLDAAVRRWRAERRPKVDRKPTADAGSEPGHAPTDDPDQVYKVGRARRELALAEIAEHQLAQLREEFVPAAEARAYMADTFTVVKTRLLGIPSRVGQQLPKLAREVEPVVDSLIREVLTELADEIDDESDDAEDSVEDEP